MKSRFLSKYLRAYFENYPSTDKPVSPKDPRSKSRALLTSNSFENGEFGALTRIMNEFPLADSRLSEPVDEFVIKDLCRVYDALLKSVKLETDTQKGGFKPIDAQTIKKIKEFLAHMISLVCHEVVTEKGELLPDVAKSLGLEELIKAKANKPEMLRVITKNVLQSYCIQMVFGAVYSAWEKNYKALSTINLPVGLLSMAMVKVFDLDPSFLANQVEDYLYRARSLSQHCAEELKTVSQEQIKQFQTQQITSSPEFLKKARTQFWSRVMQDSIWNDTARIDELNTKKIAKWLYAHDNTYIVDELHRQLNASPQATKTEKDFMHKLLACKLDRRKIQLPTNDFVKTVLSVCPKNGVLSQSLCIYARQLGIAVATPLVQHSAIQSQAAKPVKIDVVDRVLFRC